MSKSDHLRNSDSDTPDSSNSFKPTKLGEEIPEFKSIPLPDSESGGAGIPLPEMRQAVLNGKQVNDLFSDIALLASNILLIRRSTGPNRGSGGTANSEQLEAARQKLLSGETARVQIRYDWKENHWIDTLEFTEAGIKLTRIAHPVGPHVR